MCLVLRAAVAAALTLTAVPASAARPPAAETVEQRAQAVITGAPDPVPPAYAADGTLHWEPPQPSSPPADCTPTTAPVEVLLSAPRIEVWRCGGLLPRVLAGQRPDGTRWTRPLLHVSGPYRIDRYVGTVRADAITLDTLEVIDPASGSTLVPPPLRMVDTPPRPMSAITVNGPVTCPRDTGACYGYNAEGQHAGLLRIERDGRVTVLEKPQRKLLAPIAISDLQFGPSGRTLLIAESWLFRGTKWVRFAIFDLATGKRVLEQRHGEGRVVSNPRIITGPDNRAAFFYRDDTGAQYVVVHYRLRN